jgi:hypothetical protein
MPLHQSSLAMLVHQPHLPPKIQLSMASLSMHMVRPLLSLLSQHTKMATLSQNQGEHE